MKTTLIFSFHSFVDLITNSSSELFIVQTKKSLEVFRAALTRLALNYNEKMSIRDDESSYAPGALDIEGLFVHHFKEPRLSLYKFRADLYPKYSAYEFVCDWEHSRHHPMRLAADAKLKEWQKVHPAPKWPSDNDPTCPARIAYDEHQKQEREVNTMLFAEWNHLVAKTEEEFMTWVFAENGLDYRMGTVPDEEWRRMRGERDFSDPTIALFLEDVQSAKGYDYHFNAGDIILETASNNTVPYDFFEDIGHVFSVERHHLG